MKIKLKLNLKKNENQGRCSARFRFPNWKMRHNNFHFVRFSMAGHCLWSNTIRAVNGCALTDNGRHCATQRPRVETNKFFVCLKNKKKWKSANNNLIEMFVWSENIKTGFPIFCQTSPTGGT